jgi:hypothetical protein
MTHTQVARSASAVRATTQRDGGSTAGQLPDRRPRSLRRPQAFIGNQTDQRSARCDQPDAAETACRPSWRLGHGLEMTGKRVRPDWRDKAGFVACVVVLAGVAVVLVVVLAGGSESHPHGDPTLVTLVDGAHVIADYNNCSDETDFGYTKNNDCVDSRLVQASTRETAAAFRDHEIRALEHADWRVFSPASFGFHSPVVASSDPQRHDCVLLGPPAQVPLSARDAEDTSAAAVPKYAAWIRRERKIAEHPTLPIIGLQTSPGPANDPHRAAC